MRKLYFLKLILLSALITLNGCATSQPDYVIYEKHYKHRIVKVLPQTRGNTIHIHVHHHGNLTKKENRWLKRMYGRKHKKKHHRINVVFVNG